MSIEHIARSGKTYYLHMTTDSKGKTKYFFSTKSDGVLSQKLPDGYEIHENVNAQVFLRRKVQQLISDGEITLIQEALKRHSEEWRYKVEIKKNIIVIYEACQEDDWMQILPPWIDKSKAEKFRKESTRYMPIMRFILKDKGKRMFSPERYCFRGRIDDWILIGTEDELHVLVKKFIKHLGRESFYDLI
jgi:hypothetical protein